MDAYLDIETTGLSSQTSDITVIGLYLVNSHNSKLIQLVGENITAAGLIESFSGVENLYTYNGKRFDLPFIDNKIGVNLETMAAHRDLMFDCWDCNLKGGLKIVEQKLGIYRKSVGMSGLDAVLLWERYKRLNDLAALKKLLEYNREDVINLKILREKLNYFSISD
ncbi:MAG: ribonuclease H-like domain-containing protein [Dehalococcoidales bacterium]